MNFRAFAITRGGYRHGDEGTMCTSCNGPPPAWAG